MAKAYTSYLSEISLLNDKDISEEKQKIYDKLTEFFESYSERIYNIFYNNAVEHDLFFYIGEFKVSCNKIRKDDNNNFLDKKLPFYGFYEDNCDWKQIFYYEIDTVNETQSFMISDHINEMNKFLARLYNVIIEYNYYE